MSALNWDELSNHDAAALRADYVAEFPNRLGRFLDSLPHDVRLEADRTFESLEVVWKWWVANHTPPDDIEDAEVFLVHDLPLWARTAHGLSRQIGADNAHAVSELAAYAAATIIEQHPDAVWTTNPDRDYANANQPLLSRDGYGIPFLPDSNIGVLCFHALIGAPPGTKDPRAASELRRMVASLCGHESTPLGASSDRSPEESPAVVVCRPMRSMPRRTYLVLLDDDLAREEEGLLVSLREHLDADPMVTNIDDNDERSLMVTVKRFSSQHDLYERVNAFVEKR